MGNADSLILQKIFIKSLYDLQLIKFFPAIKKLNLHWEFFHEEFLFKKTVEKQTIPIKCHNNCISVGNLFWIIRTYRLQGCCIDTIIYSFAISGNI